MQRIIMEKYKMYLVLGDWSGDGHSISEKILMESNYPVDKVQQAYKDSCKLTGISFNHNEDYTGIKRDWQERDKYHIATEYGKSDVSDECVEALAKHGLILPKKSDDKEAYYDYFDSDYYWFTNLWTDFVKLSLPDLELTRSKEVDKIPVINGFWNKDLNVQFGYGLF